MTLDAYRNYRLVFNDLRHAIFAMQTRENLKYIFPIEPKSELITAANLY